MRRTRAAPRASLDECLPEDVVKRTKKKKKQTKYIITQIAVKAQCS